MYNNKPNITLKSNPLSFNKHYNNRISKQNNDLSIDNDDCEPINEEGEPMVKL